LFGDCRFSDQQRRQLEAYKRKYPAAAAKAVERLTHDPAFRRAFHFRRSGHPARVNLALHRSFTFWSGLFAMTCIVWAWWDSERYESYVTTSFVALGSKHSYFLIRNNPINGSSASRDAYSGEPLYLPEHLPPPVLVRGRGMQAGNLFNAEKTTYRIVIERIWASDPPGGWMLMTPYWLFILLTALPWFSLLFWRVRRRKRTSTP